MVTCVRMCVSVRVCAGFMYMCFKYSVPVSVCISMLVCACMRVFDVAIKFIHISNKDKRHSSEAYARLSRFDCQFSRNAAING